MSLVLSDSAKELYNWVVYLNRYDGFTYKGEKAIKSMLIGGNSDVGKNIKKLCQKRADGEITMLQFYLALYNYDRFDLDLLGPEYSNLSELFDEAYKNGTLYRLE